MNIYKFTNKIILQIIFVIIFFSTVSAKNFNLFNKETYISDYFTGILLLNNNQYNESYKFLKTLNGLEETHINYSSKYIFALVNLGKFNEAFRYSQKLEKIQADSFESNLIMGIYYLKNEKFDLAQKYFLKLKNKKLKSVLNNFISNSLLNWSSFHDLNLDRAKIKIDKTETRSENLKNIQNVFLHCFYKSEKTELLFKKLISNNEVDFSRYNYFYGVYLYNTGKIEQAKEVMETSLQLYPSNLLLNQLKKDLNKNEYKNNFNCQNLSHVAAEILYITANALSSQNIHYFSNFYLNLSKYLNNDFHAYDSLLAENFYKTKNYKEAKKIYETIGKRGEIFFWYASKQKAKILNKEGNKSKAINVLTNAYKKLSEITIYEKFDYARFLKNNDQFENSVKFYTEIIQEINKNHPLYPKATDGRGVSYERLGEWDKAEKDLLSSLESNPDQAYVLNYLAYSWIEKGVKIEKSLKMLKKANNLKSDDPYIIDSLGWALFKLGRYQDSKDYLQSAVELMPADPIINDHYGDVLWKNGKKIEARYYWNYVLNLKETEEDLKENIKNKLILGL